MEPFREVRSPERNYGPARLAGGTTVTPLARRLAGEAGIDLANVKGSGPHGRIVAADIESAKTAVASPAPAPAALAATPIVLTADVAIGRSLALCSEANAAQKTTLELADVVIKAWATALARVMPSEHAGIALAIGKSRSTIADAAAKSLTAISAARRENAGGSAIKRDLDSGRRGNNVCRRRAQVPADHAAQPRRAAPRPGRSRKTARSGSSA